MSLAYKILGQVLFTTEKTIIHHEGGGYGGYYGGGSWDETVETLVPVAAYTVPAGKHATITSIFATNQDSVQRTYDLAIVPAGETLALKHHIRWDNPIPANDFDLVSTKYTLSAGDKVVVFPSTIDKVGFTVFGVEQ